jgi:hypothetical protein
MKSIKYSLVAFLFSAGFFAHSEVRTAREYLCTAFNPVTGYAELKFPTADKEGVAGTLITYGLAKKSLNGGELSYDSELKHAYPHATLQTVINGVTVPVYLDLARPRKETKKAKLIGITYIPLFAVIPAAWLFQPYLGYNPSQTEIPVPAGFVPTSVVTCKVRF